MTHGVEGNRIYLICSVCGPDTQHSMMLGLRRAGGYCRPPSGQQLQAWFDEHEKCGGVNDKFKLAMDKPANWDAPEMVSPTNHVGAHVKTALALVKP